MKRKGTGAVAEILKEYFGRHGLMRRIGQASIVNEWAGLVGDQVASVTEPDSVDASGTLRVRVRSAAWMQELQLMSPTIIQELAKKGKRVKRIHWMLGTIEQEAGRGAEENASRKRQPGRNGT
ncbi:MAG: DUF721 domain-containing protein [Gemmatimonadales bacterium]